MRRKSAVESRLQNSVLDEFTDYTATLFHEQEEAMRHANYSGFAEHKAKHDAIIKKVF